MSNTLNLLETNDFPTSGITPTGIVTLVDSQTKELVNFVEDPTGPSTVDGVMYLQKGGVKYKRIYNGVINPEWFGSGKTHVEIQKAIDVAKNNDTILIQGQYRCSDQITITKGSITLLGQNYINGNDVGGNESSRLVFNDFTNKTVDSCIEVTTVSLCVRNLVVFGNELPGKTGIKVVGNIHGSLTLDSAVVQNFETGIKVIEGYYNRFVNSYIGYCSTCLVLDKCYNATASSLSIRAGYKNSTALTNIGILLLNNSNLTMFGGGVESFSDAGIVLSSSRVSCLGIYFEGEKTDDNASCIKISGNDSRVTAIGCHVYLKAGHASSFVQIPSTVTSAHVYSKNNHFEYSDGWFTSVYKFQAINFEGYTVDISGDNYKNDVIAGSSYTSITSSLLKKGKGMVQITYPSGHELAGTRLSNLNEVSPYQYNGVTGAEDGMITTFANSGYPGDDGASLQGTIGYTPYTAVYDNGVWKKIPKL